MLLVLNIWEKKRTQWSSMHFQSQTNICGNIFCSWLGSGQKKNIFTGIWNDAFKTVQGHSSELSVSICGSQSLKKLSSCFHFIKSMSHGDTDDQIFQRSAADMLIFLWKILSWLWESENAGDSAFPARCTHRSFQADFSLRDFYLYIFVTRLHWKKISTVCCVHRWFHQQLH